MSVALLAFDLDGTTICNDHHTVSSRNLAALENAHAKGIELVPATGRAQGRLPDFLSQLPIRYIITSNGAKITCLPGNEILYENTMSLSFVAYILEQLNPYPIYWELYVQGCCYVDASMEHIFSKLPFPQGRLEMMAKNRIVQENLLHFVKKHNLRIEKLNLPYLPPEYQHSVRLLLEKIPDITVSSSLPQNAEINSTTCNKGTALAYLCSYLNIKPEEVMALGDNGNDIEMLQLAGISAAPSNAAPCVKKIAWEIPATNEESALAIAVEKWCTV